MHTILPCQEGICVALLILRGNTPESERPRRLLPGHLGTVWLGVRLRLAHLLQRSDLLLALLTDRVEELWEDPRQGLTAPPVLPRLRLHPKNLTSGPRGVRGARRVPGQPFPSVLATNVPVTYAEIIVALISLLAVFVSLVALHRSGKLQRQQFRLQEKQQGLVELQLEMLKKQAAASLAPAQETADIRVSLEGLHGQPRFEITNWGRGTARDVKFDLKVSPGKISPLVHGDFDEKLPIPALAPGSRCSLLAAISFGTGTAFEATWSWTNPDGSEERRSSLLAL